MALRGEIDPPVIQVHGHADTTAPIERARSLHERLKSAGVKAELVVIEGANHGLAGARPRGHRKSRDIRAGTIAATVTAPIRSTSRSVLPW